MGLGIYKHGQGYWVRVLTAVFALVFIAVGCAWLGKSLGAVNLPKPTWSMTITPAAGAPELAPGQAVALLGDPAEPGAAAPAVGNAEVVSVAKSPSGTGKMLVIKKMTFNRGADVTQVKSVGTAASATAPGTAVGVIVGRPIGKPIFEPLYLQAGGVAVLVILGAVGLYWFVGARPTSVDFLIATDGEMKKVNWSTRKDVIGSTKVVILWCVLLVAGLFVVDLAFSTFFRMIGVLQTK